MLMFMSHLANNATHLYVYAQCSSRGQRRNAAISGNNSKNNGPGEAWWKLFIVQWSHRGDNSTRSVYRKITRKCVGRVKAEGYLAIRTRTFVSISRLKYNSVNVLTQHRHRRVEDAQINISDKWMARMLWTIQI